MTRRPGTTRIPGFTGLAVLAVLAPGCSSLAYHDARPVPAEARQVHGDVQQLNFAKRMQLALPARVAVADRHNGWYGESDALLPTLVSALEADPVTWSDVVPLPRAENDGTPPAEQLRRRASEYQADIYLVAERSKVKRESSNALSFLNILLLPMLFVPTQETFVGVTLHATAVDVRNGLAYTSVVERRTADVSASVAAEDSAVLEATETLYGECAEAVTDRLREKLHTLQSQQR